MRAPCPAPGIEQVSVVLLLLVVLYGGFTIMTDVLWALISANLGNKTRVVCVARSKLCGLRSPWPISAGMGWDEGSHLLCKDATW